MNSVDNVHLIGYKIEIDKVDKIKWAELLTLFDDASIHQTWSAGAVMKGEKNLSHLLLKKDDEIISICQVTLTKAPMFNMGIADIYNGPLWRKKDCKLNIDNFIQMIHCLIQEYALKRNFLLRVWPNEFNEGSDEFNTILDNLGFRKNKVALVQRTLIIDLALSMESLRNNLSKTWRLHLNRAEKSKLRVIEGNEEPLYDIFMSQMKEMLDRKRFVPRINYEKYKIIQKQLPDNLKMKIMVATNDDKPVSSIVCFAIGDTGIFLFGATSNDGLKENASNLLHWRMVQWLKENGYKRYDLGGIDPEENPGTYQFKRGLAGKIGKDLTKIGQFDFAIGWKGQLLLTLIRQIISLKQSFLFNRIAQWKRIQI